MEYAIGERLVEALNRVRSLVRSLGVPISFPVEVRVVAADDIPLSTASGRETAYIAVHVYQGTSYDQYFQGVEHIMNDYGGRPHWGKLHFQSATTLAPRYPRWDDFQGVRRRLDPDGRFTTPYPRHPRPGGRLTLTCASPDRAAPRAGRARDSRQVVHATGSNVRRVRGAHTRGQG